MGDLRPDNGGGVPPDDGGAYRRELPDLPPEWGTVVIPDDAAELNDEATVVRRELRREAVRTRLRALVGLGPGRRDAPSLGIPIVIMAVAVITTLLSLFIVTWDRRSTTEPVGPDAALQTAVPLADVSLLDASGKLVRLADVLPALLLLVDEGCDCADLIRAVAAAAPAVVTVVPVSTRAACPVGTEKKVLCLADPAGTITGRYPATPKVSASPDGVPSAQAGASASAAASGGAAVDPSVSAPPPVPTATAVPVDGKGVASDPIVVTSATDVAEALAALAASE